MGISLAWFVAHCRNPTYYRQGPQSKESVIIQSLKKYPSRHCFQYHWYLHRRASTSFPYASAPCSFFPQRSSLSSFASLLQRQRLSVRRSSQMNEDETSSHLLDHLHGQYCLVYCQSLLVRVHVHVHVHVPAR